MEKNQEVYSKSTNPKLEYPHRGLLLLSSLCLQVHHHFPLSTDLFHEEKAEVHPRSHY